MTYPYEPIHQSNLTPEDWAERLRTENPAGQLTRLLAERAAKDEATEKGRGK